MHTASFGQTPEQPFVFVKTTHQGKDGKGFAWWTHEKSFRPYGKSVAGIPVSRISKDWCYANAYAPTAFVSEDRLIQAEIDKTFRMNAISFASETHFPGSAVQRAIVGAYETCGGTQGTFTLVYEPSTAKVIVLDVLAGDENPGFAAIKWTSPSLEWGQCWECTWSDRLSYDPERKDFYWEVRNYLYTDQSK